MKLLLRTLVFLGVASFGSYASAQTPTLYYIGDTTGSLNSATDWNTAIVIVEETDGTGEFSLTVTGTGTNRAPLPTDVLLIYANTNDETLGAGGGATAITPVTITQSVTSEALHGFQASSLFGISGTINLTDSGGQTLTITGRTGDTGTGGAPYGDLTVDGGTTLNYAGGTLLVNRGLTAVGDNAVVFNGNLYNSPGSGTLNVLSGTVSFDPATGPTNSRTEVDVAEGSGSLGTVTQGSTGAASTVITGNALYIGYGGGIGTWTVANGSTLETATDVANAVIGLGADLPVTTGIANIQVTGAGSQGTLTISNNGTFILNTGADLQVGTVGPGAFLLNGGTGTITQNGAGSNVNFKGTSTVEIGDAEGSTGTYNLGAGNLNIGTTAGDTVTFTVGAGFTSNGTLSQTGGTLTAGGGSTVIFGNGGGFGTYNLSGGSADFQNGFTVGNQAGSIGTITQSGNSTLTAENPVLIGNAGTGIYTIQGGTATFSNTLTVANGGTLNINGGTLKIAEANLLSPGGNGTLNFGGGTLQFTSGTTFNDPFTNGHVLANGTISTIDASVPGTFTSVMMAPLSGNGGIAFKGTDNQTIFTLTTGANNYNGATTIISGELDAESNDILNSSSLNIGPSDTLATLKLTVGTIGLPYAGALTGTGTLDVIFTNAANAGAFVVANTSAYTGPITLGGTGGAFQIYNGTFGSISQTAPSSLVIGGTPLTGAGSVIVPLTGTVNLGSNSFSGTTTINSGFTLNVASLGGAGTVTNNGTLNIQNVGGNLANTNSLAAGAAPAVLAPTGTLTAGTTSATIIPGKTVIIGGTTLNVGGTFSSDGTIDIRTTGTTTDVINVVGQSANVSGSFISLINGSGTANYVIVKTAAPGDLTAVGTTSISSTALFSVVVAPDATDQYLIMSTTQLPFTVVPLTPNEGSVGGVLDPIIQTPPPAFAPILAAFDKLPAGAIGPALDQLTPESLQYSRDISFENATFLSERMDGICADLHGGATGLDTNGISLFAPGFDSSLGRSLGSLLAYSPFHTSAPNGVNYYPAGDDSSGYPTSSPLSPPPASSSPTSDSSGQTISDSPIQLRTSSEAPVLRTPRLSGFIAADITLADLNQNQSATNAAPSKANYTAGDALMGVSFRVTPHLSAGAFFDYNHTDAKTDSSGSKTTVDTYSPGVFATYSDHGFYANGLFAYGLNNYSNTRNISFLNTTATSSPTGQQYVTNLDCGYNFHPGPAWALGPVVGLTYTHLDIESFTENGAGGADLSVNNQSVDSLRSRLGGHLAYQTHTGNVLFQPNVTAMWQHEYLDDNNGITSQFSIPGTGLFTIQSASVPKDSALIGCGVTATLDNSMALYLNYLADIGANDYLTQSVIGGFKANF